MNAVTASSIITALIVAATLAAYDRFVVRPAIRVGVVDVGAVYREKEAEFTRILTKAGSDSDRERAIALARLFSQRLPAALDDLPHECRCLVVLSTAIAGRPPHSIDLTGHLRGKVQSP